MICLENVSFAYDRKDILRGISVQMPNAEITALIGANGSGKSTCLRLCARLLRPRQGAVVIDGRNAADYPPRAFARTVAFLPQERPVPMISVRALVAHGRFPHLGLSHKLSPGDVRAVDRAIELTGLADCAERDLRTLSGGQRQKAYLAMLIAQGSRHLLLDEPTTYLDVLHQMELLEILRALRDEGRCIVVVLHDLAQAAALAGQVVLLHDGRPLYHGAPEGLYASGAVETAFGVRPVVRTGVEFERI